MSSIEIEFPVARISEPCECCGGTTTTLNRFVTIDGEASAIYRLRFSDNHPDNLFLGLFGIGHFGDGTTNADRVAIAVSLRPEGVMVIDAEESQWPKSEILGRKLTRAEAMGRPELSRLYAVVDSMYTEDEPLRSHLGKVARPNPRLQRTPLRAPLSRQPLGDRRSIGR